MNTAYINGILLDGTREMEPLEGKVLVTAGETIAAILPKEEADLTGCRVVDLQGGYVMPGLVNLHVHIPGSGKPQKKPMDTKKLVRLVTSNALTRKYIEIMYRSYCKTELYSGVTTMRTVGGIENYDTWIRDEILAGRAEGPRVLAGNMAVSVPGGHMAGSLAYEAETPEQAAAFVERIAQDKPDLIKLMITGGVLDATERGEPGVLRMKPQLVRAACDKAHALGLKVAAHVESPEGVRVALENGVDTIEHGAKPDAQIIDLFRERGAVHVCTLSPALPYALFDLSVSHCGEMAKFNGDVVFRGIIECAKACLAAGIPVGLGTDTGCPYITHYDMWRELVYFTRYCGVSNRFALHTATCVNAGILGLSDSIGTLEPGKCADLLICDSNPLQNLQALRNPAAVVTRGRLIQRPRVKKMPRVEAELDKFL